MRFRITHLLGLMLSVAFIGTALATHSTFVGSIVVFAVWIIYAGLAWYAFVTPAKRMVIGSALIFGVSYLAMGLYYWGRLTPLAYVSGIAVDALMGPDEVGDRYTTLECAWSLIFATIGAYLGAWSLNKPKMGNEKN